MIFIFSDTVQSGNDNLVLEFNMPALSALLKRQSEQNPGASYFNVDILKYQVRLRFVDTKSLFLSTDFIL